MRDAISAVPPRRHEPKQIKEATMRHCYEELTLDELLADPLTEAVMRADGVDADQLGLELARFSEDQREAAE